MAAGVGNITVTLTRLDADTFGTGALAGVTPGDREKVKLKLSKQSTVAAIRQRVELEFGLPPHEQLLMFRGRILEKDSAQPLATPDLADIVAEAGEDGLQMAVKWQQRRLPPFLQREGLEELNDKRKTGATGLHRATRQCELGIVEELLRVEEFSGINARDRAGQTALHTATECRIREACKILLQCERFGVVGARDAEGRTALHLAAHWGDLQTCQAIMTHKAFKVEDAYAVDKLGYTALQYAIDCGHDEVAKAIAKKYPPDERPPEEDGEAEEEGEGPAGAQAEPDAGDAAGALEAGGPADRATVVTARRSIAEGALLRVLGSHLVAGPDDAP